MVLHHGDRFLEVGIGLDGDDRLGGDGSDLAVTGIVSLGETAHDEIAIGDEAPVRGAIATAGVALFVGL